MASPEWVPQHHRNITLIRLANFVDDKGLFRDASIKKTLYHRRSSACVTLDVHSVPAGQGFPKYADIVGQEFRPAKLGELFGPLWSTHWFRVTATVPEDWTGDGGASGPLQFLWDSNCEAMMYIDGRPVQSFTEQRNSYTLDATVTPGATFTFYVELAANFRQPSDEPGVGIEPPDPAMTFKLAYADLAVPNAAAWDLYYDFVAVADMARHLPEDSDVGMEALYVASKIISVHRHDDPSTWASASKLAKAFLGKTGAPQRHQVFAVGHCHIDTAWLWPFEETHRKVARSWVSQLHLFDEFPQHTFACSQAQQYQWLRDDHPDVFERVQAAAKAGRFVPTGGAWVEMDANVPSGESIVRQFLFGQRFFEAAFGARSDVFWLPDTFGYAAQLPQLAHGAGMKYFLTQKLSWNNINTFPHNTFYWQALDGTRVLTHFPPANTYNSVANVEEVLLSSRNNKDKDRANSSLLLFGNGDGGGGPTETMLRSIERLGDVDGLPRVTITPPSDFFKQLEANARDLLSWQGELYFELHRGTYTTHAMNKACNRRCEGLLREVELLAAAAALMVPGSFSYPKVQLDAIWRDVLLFQFHDVLPGSSIAEVYATCVKRYKEMIPELEQLRAEALAHVAGGGGNAEAGPVVFNSLPFARREVVEVPVGQVDPHVHALQTSADGSVYRALAVAAPMCMRPLYAQAAVAVAGNGAAILGSSPDPVFDGAEPLLGRRGAGDDGVGGTGGVAGGTGGRVTAEQSETHLILQNGELRATFDLQGRLTGLWDKAAERELVPPQGLGNRFRLYEDVPTSYDAWDVEIYHLETGWDAGTGRATLGETGPLRATITVDVPLSATSSMQQVISLDCCARRLDFACTVDWNENRRFLKVEFPWLLAADSATYETQFGAIARPTHNNTSWDWAKFEVCGHRWGDLSEPDYGVALLNDCKYGYACHGHVMRLSLLRAPKAPDAHADIGRHVLRYAVYPHAGTWQTGGVLQEAMAFNAPLLVGSGQAGAVNAPPTGALSTPLLQISKAGPHHRGAASSSTCLIIDAVKPAEPPLVPITHLPDAPVDRDVPPTPPIALIVRLYEPHGSRGTARLTWHAGLHVAKVTKCNLLEDDLEELPVVAPATVTGGTTAAASSGTAAAGAAGGTAAGGGGVSVAYTPFSVITLKLHVASAPGHSSR